MRTIIIIGIMCFIAQTASAQTVPTAAPAPTFKQAIRQENIRYSQDWHKRKSGIQYEARKKIAVLKQQFIANYHSTRDPNQRVAYRNDYESKVKKVNEAAKQEWAKVLEGLQIAHNYNIEQIYKAYGVPYNPSAGN